MMHDPSHLIEETNLSHAWGRLFLVLMARGNPHWRAPLTLSVSGFKDGIPQEDNQIRKALDRTLKAEGKFSTRTCAMTIFPFDFWRNEGEPHVEELSEAYLLRYLPRLQARDPSHNGRGVYFQRMIAFQGTKQKGGSVFLQGKNQLAHLVAIWHQAASKGCRPRRSALQVAIFDPVRDHTGSALSGFPCLQQVSLGYDENGLILNAYYPTQYILDRAYGNYLGLSHLGYFLARELGLEFVRLNCTVVHPELGDVSKTALRELQTEVERAVAAPTAFLPAILAPSFVPVFEPQGEPVIR